MEKCLHGKKTLDYAENSGVANLKDTNPNTIHQSEKKTLIYQINIQPRWEIFWYEEKLMHMETIEHTWRFTMVPNLEKWSLSLAIVLYSTGRLLISSVALLGS